jgi:hypothetical protein
MSETLIHYSRVPLRKMHSVSEQRDHFKPTGLWVSVKGPDDWKSWCVSEGFSLENLAYPHIIVLSPQANILRLSSANDIDAFTSEYFATNSLFLDGRYQINWGLVADHYDGIIIAPYIWERRLFGGANWYYSWDCASGCLWEASAVQSIIPQTRNPKVPQLQGGTKRTKVKS